LVREKEGKERRGEKNWRSRKSGEVSKSEPAEQKKGTDVTWNRLLRKGPERVEEKKRGNC